jgi:uncharacterized membrane protein YqiK
MFLKMLMLMPSTLLLLAIAVLIVLVVLAWFVGGTAPNRHVAPRPGAYSRKGDEASSIKNAASMKQAA